MAGSHLADKMPEPSVAPAATIDKQTEIDIGEISTFSTSFFARYLGGTVAY